MSKKEMRKKIHKILVKHDTDIYYLSAKLGLKLGIECITLKGKDEIQGIDFDEGCVPIKDEDVKYLYDEVRIEFQEVHLDELSEKEVAKLETEIVKGSYYLSDYKNSFGVNPTEVSNYADGYLETKEDPEEYGYYETFYDYIQSVERID
jgi:hypothetical protein